MVMRTIYTDHGCGCVACHWCNMVRLLVDRYEMVTKDSHKDRLRGLIEYYTKQLHFR